jgi:hypothetical protein
VWAGALPLFHTHIPAALDKSGGLPHTVFSSDLPGEFAAFSHRTVSDEAELSAPTFHSQELGFAATASVDGKRKPLEQTASASLHVIRPAFVTVRLDHDLPLTQCDTLHSSDSHGLRAPPRPPLA